MPSRSPDSDASADDSTFSVPAGIWRVWELLIRPTGEPAPAPPRLTLLTLLLLAGVFAAWRLAILGATMIWHRLGIQEPWPGDEVHHVLTRYSVRWDSGWYLSIIRDGYSYNPEQQSNIAFFPMLPYLTRAMDWLLPAGEIVAGLVVVHLALFGALLYIYQLVRIDFPDDTAWRTIFFLLIFPSAVFLSALYAESLLLFGMAGALYHARRGQWILAGLFGAFTGLTKLIGLVLIVPIGLEMLRQRALRIDNPRVWLGGLLALSGGVAYLAFLHFRFGDYQVYFQNQEHWKRQSLDPEPFVQFVRFSTGRDLGHLPYPGDLLPLHTAYFLLDVGALLLFLAAGAYLWIRFHPSYGALVLLGALVPGLSGLPLSLARYMVILFPAFIIVGQIRSEPIRHAITFVSMFGLAVSTYLFVNGYWAG
jgi:hypothetical protein